MLKKLTLIIFSLFLIACSNNDYGDYTRLEKPKTEIVKNYSEKQEESFENSVLFDVGIQVISDILDLGLKLLINTIIPVN